jgi:hypothetical protein
MAYRSIRQTWASLMGPVMSSLLTVRQGSFQQVSRFMGTSSWCGTLAVQQASALIVNDTL